MKWKNINDYKPTVGIEPTDDYEKAKKLIYETDTAIGKLTPHDRDKLLAEFLQYKGMYELFQEIRHYLGR